MNRSHLQVYVQSVRIYEDGSKCSNSCDHKETQLVVGNVVENTIETPVGSTVDTVSCCQNAVKNSAKNAIESAAKNVAENMAKNVVKNVAEEWLKTQYRVGCVDDIHEASTVDSMAGMWPRRYVIMVVGEDR